MATHCSILTWKMPRTEEPGGLQSTGSQRARYNLAIKLPPPPPGLRPAACGTPGNSCHRQSGRCTLQASRSELESQLCPLLSNPEPVSPSAK